jgi:nucleotide-binding universal stress UspA family protein
MIFNKLALAITFSPNQKALLNESKHLQQIFNSELILIHVGEKNIELENKLTGLIDEIGLSKSRLEVIWQTGEPTKVILEVCEKKKVDLLIAGALEKESFLKYYIGSVARKIMRESRCSVLLLSNPSLNRKSFEKICVNIEFSNLGELTAKKAYEIAKLEDAKELILIREIQLPALATTVYDNGSTEEAEAKRNSWRREEENKIDLFAQELNMREIPIKKVCLYGKQGWESGQYVREINGDLLVIPSQQKKFNFFDRLFQHDQEFIFENLPCSLLIVRPEHN